MGQTEIRQAAELATLLDEHEHQVTLKLEPALDGLPYPKQAGGNGPLLSDANRSGYEGALYIYDNATFNALDQKQLFRKNSLEQRVDNTQTPPKPYRKVYLKQNILRQYLEDLREEDKDYLKELEDNAALESIPIHVGDNAALAVAKIKPFKDGGEVGLDHALIVRVIADDPSSVLRDALAEAGLVRESGRFPHAMRKDTKHHAYSFAVPITEKIAHAILANPTNHCLDWTHYSSQKPKFLKGNQDLDELVTAAQRHIELEAQVQQAPAVVAKPRQGDKLPVVASLAVAPQPLRTLASFVAEFKDELHKAGFVVTTQTLPNGTVHQLIGTSNVDLMNSMIAKSNISDPLVASQYIAGKGSDRRHYYMVDAGQQARLMQLLGVDKLPSIPALPLTIPSSLFRFNRQTPTMATPISDAWINKRDGVYELIVVCPSVKRLEMLAGSLGFKEEQRQWVRKDTMPAILKLPIPAEAVKIIQSENLQSSVGGKSRAPAPRKPKLVENIDDKAILSAFPVDPKSVATASAAASKGGSSRLPKMTDEQGLAKLQGELKAALEKDGFHACAANVRITLKSRGREPIIQPRIYVRGKIAELRQLGSALKADTATHQSWLDKTNVSKASGRNDNPDSFGLLSIAMPEGTNLDDWQKMQAALGITLVTPAMVDQKLLTNGAMAEAFANANQAKELANYFDRTYSVKEHISPLEMAIRNLSGKHVRIMTITSPDESTLEGLDKQIAALQDSMATIRASADALREHADQLRHPHVVSDDDAIKLLGVDSVGATVIRAARGAQHAAREQSVALDALKAKVAGLRESKEEHQRKRSHDELLVIDPDSQTEKLLTEAGVQVIGTVAREGSTPALRVIASKALVERLDAAPLSSDNRMVPEGTVETMLADALRKHHARMMAKRAAASDAEQTEAVGESEEDEIPIAPILPPPSHRQSIRMKKQFEGFKPLLVYEQSSPEHEPEPVLILPVRDGAACGRASDLCEELYERGWLESSDLHYLNYNKHAVDHDDEIRTRPKRKASTKPQGPRLSEMDQNITIFLSDLSFHLPNVTKDQGALENCRHWMNGLIADIKSLDANSQTALLFTKGGREGALTLKPDLLKQIQTFAEPDPMGAPPPQPTESQAKTLAEALTNARQIIVARATAQQEAHAPQQSPAEMLEDALRVTRRQDAVPALKIYMTPQGVEAMKEWGRNSKVAIDTKTEPLQPEALFKYAAGRIKEQGRDAQHSGRRQG